MTKLTEEEKKEKRLQVLEQTCLDLLEIVNKLMPTVNTMMDAMMTQDKSINGICDTVGIHTTTQENMMTLITDAMARLVKIEAELKISSKPEDKAETKLFYVS